MKISTKELIKVADYLAKHSDLATVNVVMDEACRTIEFMFYNIDSEKCTITVADEAQNVFSKITRSERF